MHAARSSAGTRRTPTFASAANAAQRASTSWRLRRVLGHARHASACQLVSRRSRSSTSGSCRTRSGISAGTLNACFNCLDRHVAAGLRQPDRLSLARRARTSTGRSPTPSSTARFEVRQRARARLVSTKVTRWRSIWAWCPSSRSPCWPARVSPRRTAWCSAASRPESLADRINDAARGPHHPGRRVAPRGAGAAKGERRRSARADHPVEHVVVLHGGRHVPMTEGRDHWWQRRELLATPQRVPSEPMDSEDMLFILYTSGTTGKPRASSTRQAAISRRRDARTAMCSTSSPSTTSTGARRTSAG